MCGVSGVGSLSRFPVLPQHNDEFQSGELGAKNAERAAEREETKEARIARNQAEMQSRKKSGPKKPGPMKKKSKKPETPVSNKTVIDYSDSKAPNDGDVCVITLTSLHLSLLRRVLFGPRNLQVRELCHAS